MFGLSRNTLFIITWLLSWGGAGSAFADAEGSAFAHKVHYRPNGDDYVALTTMTLSGGGRDRVRKMYMYRWDGKQLGDTKAMVRFIEPGDIAGTGLLTLDYADKEDSDQWVYLPALGKERRISSQRKSGKFVGSDLYFEDMRDRDPGKDDHTIIGKEMINGKQLIKMESVPAREQNSVYSKRIGWIDPDTLVPMRLDYYVDGGSEPVKRFEVLRVEKVNGFWTSIERTMTDLQGGTSTRLVDAKPTYDQGIPEKLFSARYLRQESRLEKKWRP